MPNSAARLAIAIVIAAVAQSPLWSQAKSQRRSTAPSNAPQGPAPETRQEPWRFAVSGDSRNCGDIVMPSIAHAVTSDGAAFYWHLGDFRAIYTFDQDMLGAHGSALNIASYLATAWDDFIANQIAPFGTIPVFLGIGNHELIPPKEHNQFLMQFADWLEAPPIREQRLRDDPTDHKLRAYYHWSQRGIDFINMDNSGNEFDADQLTWLRAVVERDSLNQDVKVVVVGMHEALPDSISESHSMSQDPTGVESGRAAYQMLLAFHHQTHKPMYVLASHSHFFMEGIYNTQYWRQHGGVLPGWIIGTAGAERYALPPGASDAKAAKTHVYGYLLATVSPSAADPVHFEFKELTESDVLPEVRQKYQDTTIHQCFVANPPLQ